MFGIIRAEYILQLSAFRLTASQVMTFSEIMSSLARYEIFFPGQVSYYHHAGGGRTKYIDERHYDYFKAQKGFEYLLKTIAERDRNTWPNRQFIFFQIFDDEGNLTVNWLNRTNTLDNDLKKFAMKFGFDFTKKGKQRIGHNEDYRSFYTSELVILVKTTWKRELKIFGFSFDEDASNDAYLGNNISPEIKDSIKYFWKDDKLFIDGKIVE